MAATGRSGSSRRKAEIPGKIRIQLKGKNSKVLNSDDEDEPVAENVAGVGVENDESDNLPVTFDSGVPDDLPEGTFVVRPEPVEDNQIKKKREAAVRIDTSVLDNVSCTACGRQVNPYKGGALQKHPTLKVVICKRCEKFLSSSEIAKDKDGTDEQCRWCGEGGRLVVCDDCASAFCKACVMRNFNRSEFNNINSQQNWKCYMCNKAPLHNLRENYRKIRDTLKALQEKDKAKAVTQAAAPTTNTPAAEKPAPSKQMFKSLLPPSPSMKAGSASLFSTQKNSVSLEAARASLSSQKSSAEMSHKLPSNDNTKGTVFGIEDINVTVDNVFAVVDKLTIATDTFREILHAVQSQSQFSVSTNMNFHALRLHCAKTLNMGIDTYIKSLKTILSGSQHMHDNMAHMMFAPDMFQAMGSIGPASSMSASEAFALSRLPPNPFMMSLGSNVNHHSSRNIIDTILAQQSCSASTSAVNYMSEVKQESKDLRKDIFDKQNGSLLKEKDSSISNSDLYKESSKDYQKDLQRAKDKNTECVVDNIETVKTSNDRSSIVTEDCKGSLNKKTEQGLKTNKLGSKIKDEEGSKLLENSSTRQKKKNENTSDKELHTDQDKTFSEVPDVVIKKEVSSPTLCSGSADDNIDAKFDLIKELADEMLRDGEDKEERSGDSAETDCLADHLAKTSNSKGKKSDNSSDSNAASNRGSKRQKKGVGSPAGVQESNVTGDPDAEASKQEAERSAGEQDSSSSVMSSDGDDDVDLATRRKMKLKSETQKPAEKVTRQKQEKKKSEEKIKTNGKPEPLLENSKVNGNSVKKTAASAEVKTTEPLRQPSERKRKTPNLDKDEESSKKVKVGPKIEEKRRSKPGPKSSKKGTDYDHHSSGGNTMEGCYDDDDEDEPTVTFFLDSVEDQQDVEEGGEVVTENGDLDNTKIDDEECLSGNEDDKTVKKTRRNRSKKAQKKDSKDGDLKDDDDNEGSRSKRKKVNKVRQTNSDSESETDKPRKKVKDEDDDSFKAGDSSSSSANSDASNSDDADESYDSEAADDNGEPKLKKKGKRKSRRKKRKSKSQKESEDEDIDNEDQDGDEEKSGKKKKSKEKKKTKKTSSSDDDGDDAEEEDKDDDDDDDDDDPNSSKAGKRKQIRKVMSSKRLEDSTKAAAKAEEKRRRRIAAKQREFNIETITDENNPMNCPITTKLVLEAGKEEGDEPLIQVNKKLVRKLKPHQVEGVQFMWDCMYESVKRAKKEPGAGCILAHCMGLGKTLSVVSFVHTILSHEAVLNHRTCLVVSPLNTVLNWRNEWGMWLDEEDQLEVWELASCKQNAARVEALKEWHENGGVMIMGYEMYRNLTTGSRCKNKRQKKIFQDTLVDPGPDLVICDEGHILKNETSAISKAMNQMKTRRRVVLTGTPLQNNLTEYHCMVSFVKPSLLGTRKEFTNRFINPINNGQCTDSTPRDVKIMKARAHVLHEMLAGCVQRRDYSALTKFLPPKQEYVISVRLTNIQIELYEKYLEITGQGLDGVFSNKGARLFADYQNLMKIWTHPWVLKLAEIRDELKMKYDDDDSFIDDDDSEEEQSFSSSGSSSEGDKGVSDNGKKGASAKLNMQRGTKRTRAKARRQAGEDSDPEEVIAEWKSKTRNSKFGDDSKMDETDKSVTKEWWAAYVTEDDKLKLELSNKLHLLFEILRMCEEIGDKVLIFSQSILSLNIIESFLEVVDSKYQQERESLTEEEHEKEMFGRSWTKNLDYYRMDGSTSAQNRQLWASNFNDIENYRARLFLISTRAGGLGINLVAANRVIIFDASWNPSHDVQSIFRVYRFGQTKPCYIYRFLAQGTMEEKIYERQVTKLSLSQRVVDEHQIERHFSANDLKELYNFRPDRWDDGTEKATLALPKDPLLAEVLTSNKHCVFAFHEHDSLLENQVEQTLTEEEKKAAWEEYENEKKGIIIRGPGMERTASWPMMAAAQILSREQITATVQALRQQLPDVSEDLFHLHLQQALRRQVQIKQEEMRRMELLRLQEMNYLNMIKQQAQQSGLTHAQSLQAMQNMAPWMQIQRLRAMQQSMLMGAGHLGMIPSASMSLLGQALNSAPMGSKQDDAIDLDDNN
ncbi:hypothetical protein BsWGS_17884 [Bradybaena similaris]